MKVAIVHSRAEIGTSAPPVTVEVFLSGGLPTFLIVGLAEAAVRESKDRVRGAVISSGFAWPQQRITVSLGPADLKKRGGRFDLPIAIGILVASRQCDGEWLDALELYGELALDGTLRDVRGLFPSALSAADVRRTVIVPAGNAPEAALSDAQTLAADSLLDVTAHLGGDRALSATRPAKMPPASGTPDLADVRGQAVPKRALEIAAAGGHNLLMLGPPGTGKTMLAQRLSGLLPPPDRAAALETAAVRSVAGIAFDPRKFRTRPFRAPHHSASAVALVGGGSVPRPGEISLAHNGVLFLDELPEFKPHVLDSLREPLEAGRVAIARADYRIEYPANFQLVAAMNPCPCGYLGDPVGDCSCSGDRVSAYRGRLSGPFLDRIDLQVEVARQSFTLIRGAGHEETTETVAGRVAAARNRALKRQGCLNAALDGDRLNGIVDAPESAWKLIEQAADRFRLSARLAYRVARVARTIADLAGEAQTSDQQVAEALSLRQSFRR